MSVYSNTAESLKTIGRLSTYLNKADVRLYGLSDGADLVDFEQQAVAGSLLCSFLYPLGVGHRQVVPDNLDPHLGRQTGPGLPVVLVERVLDGHHCEGEAKSSLKKNILSLTGEQQRQQIKSTWVVVDEALVDVSQLLSRDVSL